MTVDLAEIARYMRMGRTTPEGELAARVSRLRDEALKTIRPARANVGMPARGGFPAADSAAFFQEKFEFAGKL